MSNADWINLAIAIATAVSSLISLLVVYLTLQVLRANRAAVDVMQAQLDSVTRPNISIGVRVRPMTTFFELTVSNSGAASADNLRLTIDRDYYFNAEETASSNLRQYPAFVHPIDSFSPKASITFALGAGFNILNSDRSPLRFKITAAYDWSGRQYSETTSIDLHPFRHAIQNSDAVAERLDRIAKAVEAISLERNT